MTEKKNSQVLRFEFNKAVEETLKDHPQLAEKIVFVDVLDGNKKHGDEKAVEESRARHVTLRMQQNISLVRQRKTSVAYSRDTHGIGALLFYSADYKNDIFSKDDKDAASYASFDHELGHLVTKGGFADGKNHALREVAADSYAMIRNIQRFGKDKAVGGYAGFKRALNFIMLDNSLYLTTFAIDAIMADRDKVDFSKLSPQETADKADAYAKKHALPEAQARKLHKFFFPVRGVMAASGDMNAALKQMAHLVLKDKAPPEAFYLGKRVIDGLTAEGGLKGLDWDEIRGKIAAKAKKSPAVAKLPPPKAI